MVARANTKNAKSVLIKLVWARLPRKGLMLLGSLVGLTMTSACSSEQNDTRSNQQQSAVAEDKDSNTKKHADLGWGAYMTHCASCHGARMVGTFGPPLRGTAFTSKWNDAGPSALHDYIVATMPPVDPGGLKADKYQAITEFVRNPVFPGGSDGSANMESTLLEGTAEDEILNETAGLALSSRNEDAIYRQTLARRADRLKAIKPVNEQALRRPSNEDWLHWRRTDEGLGHSPLDQINRENVHSLTLAWSQALPRGTNSITPLVHDGIMFINSNGIVQALDVTNGELLWKFTRRATVSPIGPPVTQPRSMAIYHDHLYVPTLDNHIIALNVRTGTVVWDHLVSGVQDTLRMTSGPIVARGKVIQGMSGCAGVGEPGGCFIIAIDAETGEEAWRFYTLQKQGAPEPDTWNNAPDDRRFGGSVWVAGTYNVEDNLVYFGTGQTYHITPLMSPPERSEKNSALYTDTTLALNPDTGELVWHYQHMARDVWDLDWPFERMVISLPTDSGNRKVVVNMGKIGILDVNDAKTGEYLFSFDLGLQNIVIDIDPKTGWKTTDPALEPNGKEPLVVCPFALGVRNWPATSYDPSRHILYVPLFRNTCMNFTWSPGEDFDINYGLRAIDEHDGNFGALAAIDLNMRKLEWVRNFRAPVGSAALSTAGGIVFAGNRDSIFRAFDSATGETIWKAKLDNTLSSYPITFARDSIQYVAITSGGGNPNDILPQPMTPEIEAAKPGTTLWVFKLPDK